MKFLIKIVFLIFVLSKIAQSQAPQLIGPPGGSVYYNQFVIHPQNPNIIVSSTWSAAVFRSLDAGETVEQIEIGAGHDQLGSIELPSENQDELFIEASGYYLFSTDIGKNWNIISDASNGPCLQLNPKNSNTVFINVDDKTLWRSYDKGLNWTLVKTFSQFLTRIAVSGSDTSIIYAAGDYSLFRSYDSGNNWDKIYSPPDTNFFGVDQMEVHPFSSDILFVKAGGYLYKSSDGGNSFIKKIILNMSSFAVNPVDTSIIFVTVGDKFFSPVGDIRKTTDGGNNWFSITNDIPAEIVTANTIKVNQQNPEEIYVDLTGLGIFKSTNGGVNWKRTNLCFSDIADIYIDPDSSSHILSSQYGWYVMKTTNNGENWHQPFVEGWIGSSGGYLLTFNSTHRNIGILGSESGFYKTTDYGNTWHKKNLSSSVYYCKYHTYNSSMLYLTNDDGTFSSSDNGETWEKLYDEKNIGLFVFHPDSVNIIYAYIFDALRKSTDGGRNWVKIHSGLKNTTVNFITSFALDVNNPEKLYCTQGPSSEFKGSLSMSTNGGKNWIQIGSSLSQLDPFVNITCILLDQQYENRIFIGLDSQGQPFSSNFSNGGLFLTENNGETWRKIYNSSVNLLKADKSNPRNIYMGTKFGIMKFLDTLAVTSILEELPPSISDSFLSQNYPNPFNSSTKISYSIKEDGLVTLKVYDVLGNEICALVNEVKPKGNYEVEFNASNLPSGVYFYKIHSGKYFAVNKMVLMR